MSTPFSGLIAATAQRYQLPTALLHALIAVESDGNPWAVRYEPAFFARYIEAKRWPVFGAVSSETEKRLLATSFGLCQVMGVTARELGFTGAFLTQLCAPALSLDYGCRYLAQQRARYATRSLRWAVAAYNAGTPKVVNGVFVNEAYVKKVERHCGPGVLV